MKNYLGAFMRRRRLSALALLILLIMAPNLAWLYWDHGIAVWVTAIILPAFLLLALFAILSRLPWIVCIVLAPFAMLAPTEFFYIVKYRHPSTYDVFATVIATNPGETVGYFGWVLAPLLISMVAGLMLAVTAARRCYRDDYQWHGRLRDWIVAGTVMLPIAVFIVGALKNEKQGFTNHLAQGATNVRKLVAPIEPGFPFGITIRAAKFYRAWQDMYDTVTKLDSFRFHATLNSKNKERQIYVLVIGESSRRDHWELFGYERQTNPELSKIGSIVPITDMLTSYAATTEAVPIMLTRKPVTSFQTVSKEASILRAMSEAGFETWWISNQVAVGKYESSVATYALEAQNIVYLNDAIWTTADSYDDKLLEPLKNAINKSQGSQFIILHMMGSHTSYDSRYPDYFTHFHPTISEHQIKPGWDNRETNSYDNTIVYTDHILAKIIVTLKGSGAITAMWYESDHGETLTTTTCDYHGHGYGTRGELQIPALLWYSDAYAKAFPDRLEAFLSNAKKPTISANTFESLIDMTGVTFPDHDESMSLFSHRWSYRPRIVHSFWELDYDHAKFDKNCELPEPNR